VSIIYTINQKAKQAVRGWLGLELGNGMSTSETSTQKLIQTYRDYYGGKHKIYLTDRQKAWLDQHDGDLTFTVNHSATVVDAVVEKLQVIGFEASDPEAAALLWEWWQANRMDVVQVEAHRWAVRDGEAGILTTWNEVERRPDYVLHQRFIAKTAGGDGYGVWVEYPNDNWMTNPTHAVKQWTDENNKDRRTVYYPDRIERLILERSKWVEYRDNPGDPWPTPWVTSAGQPIGIPVAHLRNSGLESDLKPVIPLQDALNKAWLDIMAASDTTAFRMLAFFGWIPTSDGKEPADDGSNLLAVAPGQMLATRKRPTEASIHEIEPADLGPLLEIEERIVYRMALLSGTPASRFLTSRQVASDETLKEQQEPLNAKVEERQSLFGNAWEDLGYVSLKMAQAFGGYSLADDVEIETTWKPARPVKETEQIASAQGKKGLGIPIETLWAELGYDQDEIAAMKKTPSYRASMAMMNIGVGSEIEDSA